jgi:diguanylate cyclase (GGDEF)-like protein
MNEIIKESLEKIRSEHMSLTPDNYAKIFCQIAKKRGVVVEDCQKIDKYISRLDAAFTQEAKRLNINTVEELLSFFVAKLNRLNPGDSLKLIQSLVLMNKRILQAIGLLHNKRARELANASLERLDSTQNIQSIELVKDKWFDFINEYDDSFLRKLDGFGPVNKDDLQATVNDIYKLLSKENDNTAIYRNLAPLIIATLTPSIASSMNDDLATISYELRNSPEVLGSAAIQNDIKNFIKKRIDLDKKEIKEKISTLDKLLDEINQKIVHLIESSHSSSREAQAIKEDLSSINFSQDSFESIQAKLVQIASSLEFEAKTLNQKMIANQETIQRMHTRIKKLENALVSARLESKEDFLTTVSTKRALSVELKRAEEGYVRYKIDYSLCFIDLDHFKTVNDTFGHEAGDVILKTVGKILQKLTRQVDVVGRYGGEEFLVILPSTPLPQGIAFAQKVRQSIEHFKFIYKKERIPVTVSCGVSERKNHQNQEEAIQSADKMLYEAKAAGRNQVKPAVG